MSSWRVLLAVLATALATVVAAAPVGSPASAEVTMLQGKVADTTVGARTVAHARVRDLQGCSPYAACRGAQEEGTITWTLISRRDPEVRLQHTVPVEHGRARWRTPKLLVRGTWYVRAAYSGTDRYPATSDASTFRVTRH